MKKYKTIVIDPPWKYGKWGKGSKNCALAGKKQNKDISILYSTMSIDEIKRLDIGSIAEKDCELYLWTTSKYLPDAFDILQAWGFKYCQTLVWCKTPRGIGQGGLYCPTTEFILLGRKGKMPRKRQIDSTWWQVKRTMSHSKKPEFFQNLIEKVSDAPRLEMFARRQRSGWDVIGNEIDGMDIVQALKLLTT